MNPNPTLAPRPARYVMVGGFLGAGKTTALLRFAHWLVRRGLTAGLITNDQGSRLVDTRLLAGQGFRVEEIPGGCFCCRFDSLVEAARRLRSSDGPEVLLAEPVGSCTDLVATVSHPLREIYGDAFRIAPLSVVVDPVRAQRIFGLAPGPAFSTKVHYLYRKQLEEADVLVLNKCDLMPPAALERLSRFLRDTYPVARQFAVSARQDRDLEPWFEHLLHSEQTPRTAMEVDYDLYAAAEASLAWLNATYLITAPAPWDGQGLLRQAALRVQETLRTTSAEIAHLKMSLEPTEGLGDLGLVNLVGNEFKPELVFELSGPLRQGRLTVNLRAEAAPDLLRQTVQTAVTESAAGLNKAHVTREHLQFFRPPRPKPTHRGTAPGG